MAEAVTVRKEVVVDTPIERAFTVFTDQFGDFKPPEHNLLGAPIAETVFEPRAGGHIYDRAEDGTEIAGETTGFEYWSLGSDKGRENGFGYIYEPVPEGRRKSGIPREDFLPKTEDFLRQAIARWLLGSEPFTAMLHPDMVGYNDYDQLMRLDEWIGWLGDEEEA